MNWNYGKAILLENQKNHNDSNSENNNNKHTVLFDSFVAFIFCCCQHMQLFTSYGRMLQRKEATPSHLPKPHPFQSLHVRRCTSSTTNSRDRIHHFSISPSKHHWTCLKHLPIPTPSSPIVPDSRLAAPG